MKKTLIGLPYVFMGLAAPVAYEQFKPTDTVQKWMAATVIAIAACALAVLMSHVLEVAVQKYRPLRAWLDPISRVEGCYRGTGNKGGKRYHVYTRIRFDIKAFEYIIEGFSFDDQFQHYATFVSTSIDANRFGLAISYRYSAHIVESSTGAGSGPQRASGPFVGFATARFMCPVNGAFEYMEGDFVDQRGPADFGVNCLLRVHTRELDKGGWPSDPPRIAALLRRLAPEATPQQPRSDAPAAPVTGGGIIIPASRPTSDGAGRGIVRTPEQDSQPSA